MLPARSMFYALIVMLVVALTSAAWVSLSYLDTIQHEELFQRGVALRNADSAIEWILTNDEVNNYSKLNTETDSLDIQFKNWGYFSAAMIKSVSGSAIIQKSLLVGPETIPYPQTALYLQDQKTALYLAGSTVIDDQVHISNYGIKRGNIKEHPYHLKQLPEFKSAFSKGVLPELEVSQFPNEVQDVDNLPDSLYQSFHQPTLRFTGTDINLEEVKLIGNIIVEADRSITIDASAILEHLILKAPVIEIKDGFKGAVQVYGSENISIGKRVELEYPSIVALESSSRLNSIIKIDSLSKVHGAVLTRKIAKSAKPVVQAKNIKIDGMLYSQGVTNIQGSTIAGTVFAKEFISVSNGRLYKNHLLNTRIQPSKLSREFVFPSLYKNENRLKIVTWLD